MFSHILIVTLILGTALAQLPPKVIKMKESLSKELQSIPEVVSKHRSNHAAQIETNARVHQLFNEFIEQNQHGLDAVLRVLQLIDHDLENVIQDCVRIFDIESLQSSNRIFVNVTKPLLDQVERLCQIVTENRIEELEASLEQVERTARCYREQLDQTLKDIAVILSKLEDSSFSTRIQSKEVQMLDHLSSLNSSLLEPIEQNFTNYFSKWISGYRNFTLSIPEDFSEEQPDVSNLFDFLDFLDNETSILQGELHEFLEFWFSEIEEVVLAISNGTEEVVGFLKVKLLDDLLDGNSELKCAASYLQLIDPAILDMFNGFYQCVEFEEEMTKAFQQVSSVLDSTDKVITFLMRSYLTCAKVVAEFDEFTLDDCLLGMDELLEQTQEFVEHKTSEIYYHVEDALIFNGVMIEACLGNKLRESVLSFGKQVQQYYSCNGVQTDGPVMLPMF
ncbi:uncharacterized protein LOC6044712 [Culex quinquefasciatus]|uniref:uncharacterized protein LOC6044712 n=1 Tax=Culex quinquefasciatus TaxID=7176 RepID=UPI0018E38DCD|nr:uncharacterized protein LOC6044712 [Culex quinquefasciatus]